MYVYGRSMEEGLSVMGDCQCSYIGMAHTFASMNRQQAYSRKIIASEATAEMKASGLQLYWYNI